MEEVWNIPRGHLLLLLAALLHTPPQPSAAWSCTEGRWGDLSFPAGNLSSWTSSLWWIWIILGCDCLKFYPCLSVSAQHFQGSLVFLMLYMLRISSGSCSSALSSPNNPLGQPPAPVVLLELPSTENTEEEPKGRGRQSGRDIWGSKVPAWASSPGHLRDQSGCSRVAPGPAADRTRFYSPRADVGLAVSPGFPFISTPLKRLQSPLYLCSLSFFPSSPSSSSVWSCLSPSNYSFRSGSICSCQPLPLPSFPPSPSLPL